MGGVQKEAQEELIEWKQPRKLATRAICSNECLIAWFYSLCVGGGRACLNFNNCVHMCGQPSIQVCSGSTGLRKGTLWAWKTT